MIVMNNQKNTYIFVPQHKLICLFNFCLERCSTRYPFKAKRPSLITQHSLPSLPHGSCWEKKKLGREVRVGGWEKMWRTTMIWRARSISDIPLHRLRVRRHRHG